MKISLCARNVCLAFQIALFCVSATADSRKAPQYVQDARNEVFDKLFLSVEKEGWSQFFATAGILLRDNLKRSVTDHAIAKNMRTKNGLGEMAAMIDRVTRYGDPEIGWNHKKYFFEALMGTKADAERLLDTAKLLQSDYNDLLRSFDVKNQSGQTGVHEAELALKALFQGLAVLPVKDREVIFSAALEWIVRTSGDTGLTLPMPLAELAPGVLAGSSSKLKARIRDLIEQHLNPKENPKYRMADSEYFQFHFSIANSLKAALDPTSEATYAELRQQGGEFLCGLSKEEKAILQAGLVSLYHSFYRALDGVRTNGGGLELEDLKMLNGKFHEKGIALIFLFDKKPKIFAAVEKMGGRHSGAKGELTTNDIKHAIHYLYENRDSCGIDAAFALPNSYSRDWSFEVKKEDRGLVHSKPLARPVNKNH